jgi:hypothetical protein
MSQAHIHDSLGPALEMSGERRFILCGTEPWRLHWADREKQEAITQPGAEAALLQVGRHCLFGLVGDEDLAAVRTMEQLHHLRHAGYSV